MATEYNFFFFFRQITENNRELYDSITSHRERTCGGIVIDVSIKLVIVNSISSNDRSRVDSFGYSTSD